MKKLSKIFLIAMVIVVSFTALAGCNIIKNVLGLGGNDDGEVEFALSTNKVEIALGNTYEVKTIDGVTANFTLTSTDKDEEYISISKHAITAKKVTSTDITVTATTEDGETDTLSVKVGYASVSFVNIVITNDVPAHQLLSSGESPREIEFGIEYNDDTAKVTGAQVTWTVYRGTYKCDTQKGLTYSYTPSKETDYRLEVEVGSQVDTLEFGAHGAIFITADESYEVGEDIAITVVFIADGYNDGDYVDFKFELDGFKSTKHIEISKSSGDNRGYATIAVPAYDSIGTHTAKVTLDENVSNEITLNVEKYVTAERISIKSVGNLNQVGTEENVTFTATVTPSNTDKSSVKWYVNGVQQSTTGTTFNFTPNKHNNAEYHVEAKLDNLASSIKTIVYMNSASEVEYSYITNLHKYGGYDQNRYITNAEELKNIVLYAIENQLYGNESDKLSLYMGYNYQASVTLGEGIDNTDANRFSAAVANARGVSEESGILPGFSFSYSNSTQYDLYFVYKTEGTYPIVNEPTMDAPDTQANTTQSTLSKPHYSTGSAHDFYIDSVDECMEVNTSNMLYKAVQWGYKPTFESNAHGNKLKSIYDNAKDALSKIITAGMTDLEKVHAIYDWICYNVRYDYDCSEAPTTDSNASVDLNNKMKYYGYYLEGIFLDEFYDTNDSHAVCDGRSKAFALMCGIEGIKAVRISGMADNSLEGWTAVTNPDYYYSAGYKIYKIVNNNYVAINESTFGSGTYYINPYAGGHAWNKVLLDVGGDENKKEWFFIDTTWGDSGKPEEYLSHAYFLISDLDVFASHAEQQGHNYPDADTEYNYYENKTCVVSGKTQSYKVTNELLNSASTQLARLIKHERSLGNKYIEFESPYAKGTTSLSNMITEALSAAGYSGSYTTSYSTDYVIAIILNS